MAPFKIDGAAVPGLAAPESAHYAFLDLAPLGTTTAPPDVAASNDEALAGGAAQGSREQKTANASIASATGAADMARHPLSAAFGDMPTDEFDALVADIKRNGLVIAIVKANDGRILDGWHRYRACIAASATPRFEPFNYVVEAAAEGAGREMTESEFACAQNAHRRHLAPAQRREIVSALLKADPSKSDRAIGGMARVDGKTVGAARAKLEATAEIPQLTTTTGRDGKARPTKATKATKPTGYPQLTAAAPVPAAPATGVAASAAKPRALGRVQWKSTADRERVLKAIDVGAVALRRLAREIGSVKRTQVEQVRAKLLAAMTELDRMLEVAQ